MPEEEKTLISASMELPPRVNEFRRFLRVFLNRGLVIFGLVIIVAFIISAALANVIAPYDPNQSNLDARLLQPSWEHPLGTDNMGRDTLSRLIYGSRISLLVGVLVVGLAATVGMTLGLIAGYFGGWAEAIIMRSIDTLMSIPMILLALAIASMLGGGLKNVIIALAFGILPTYARLMCGQVLTVKESDYILAGHSIGAGHLHIMLRHVFPNCLPPLIVLITMVMGTTILAEAGLSFLGIGVMPPTPAWGSMVTDGREYLLENPMLSFAPGLAIMLVVFAFNMVGDGLRDALDPRLRGVL
jgi:peptide/nickel transport system permease protein